MNRRDAVILLFVSIILASNTTAQDRGYWDWNWSFLATLHDAIEGYRLVHGDYPRSTLDRPWGLAIAEDGRFGRQTQQPFTSLLIYNRNVWDPDTLQLIDRWGAPFVYIPPGNPENKSTEVILRSCGPNGIDEQGLGDDLRFEHGTIRCNDGFHWKSEWPQARRRSFIIGFVFVFIVFPTVLSIRALRQYANSVFIVFLALGYITVHRLWFARVSYPYMRPPYEFGAGLLIIGVFTFHAIRALFRRSVAERRVSLNHCPECDYDLTDLGSPRCPECGSTIPMPDLAHSP